MDRTNIINSMTLLAVIPVSAAYSSEEFWSYLYEFNVFFKINSLIVSSVMWNLALFFSIAIIAQQVLLSLHEHMFRGYTCKIIIVSPRANELTLYLIFFQREHKHTFTYCVISPHWYDACSWNPHSNKTRTYLFYIVNIMAADVLATQGAAMFLILGNVIMVRLMSAICSVVIYALIWYF